MKKIFVLICLLGSFVAVAGQTKNALAELEKAALKNPVILASKVYMTNRLQYLTNGGQVACVASSKPADLSVIPGMPSDTEGVVAIELKQECSVRHQDGSSVAIVAKSIVLAESDDAEDIENHGLWQTVFSTEVND